MRLLSATSDALAKQLKLHIGTPQRILGLRHLLAIKNEGISSLDDISRMVKTIENFYATNKKYLLRITLISS